MQSYSSHAAFLSICSPPPLPTSYPSNSQAAILSLTRTFLHNNSLGSRTPPTRLMPAASRRVPFHLSSLSSFPYHIRVPAPSPSCRCHFPQPFAPLALAAIPVTSVWLCHTGYISLRSLLMFVTSSKPPVSGSDPKATWPHLRPPLFRQSILAVIVFYNSVHRHFSVSRPSPQFPRPAAVQNS